MHNILKVDIKHANIKMKVIYAYYIIKFGCKLEVNILLKKLNSI